MPVSWRDSLRADKARHPAFGRLSRFDHARTWRDRPERARSHQKPGPRQTPGRRQPEARTARAPVRWRVSWRAHRPAYQPAPALRARRRPERARSHQKPAARQKPGRRQPEARTARAPPLVARMVARAPTGIPARAGVTRQTPPRTRQKPEPARSQHHARASALPIASAIACVTNTHRTARVHATNINRFTFSTTITITRRAA